MNCCGQITNFGCFCYCDDIFTTEITPTLSGLHILEYHFSGNVRSKKFICVCSSGFKLPNIFNEDGLQFFKIVQPNGEYFELNGSDCFSLTVTGCSTFEECYKPCDEIFNCLFEDTKVDCL